MQRLNKQNNIVMDNQISQTKIKLQGDKKQRAQAYEEKVSQTKAESHSCGFFELFRFADSYDYIMMVLGTLGAVGLGASTPLFILFWGDFTDVFGQDNNEIVKKAFDVLLKFIYLGIGALFAGWIMISGWLITGERQANLCRKTYFATLLRQQIGWFDSINQAELSSNFTSDTQSFQGAIGQKVAIMLHVTGTFIGGFIIAFIKGWVMTLVCLAAFPLIGIAGYLYMRSLQSKSSQFQKYYSKAGGLVEQAFFSIKTVKQLNGQNHEQKNYEDCLGQVKQNNLSFGMKIAASMAFMHSAMFLLYSVGYWFGSHCAEQGSTHCPQSVSGGVYSAGNVITVFFAVLVGCFNLSQLSPALKKIAEGRQSAARIFDIIDRVPKIVNPENGIKPEKITGHIKFENVVFSYPKDKTKRILNNINIEFHLSNTALVGQSGCGKSTILQLIMRFYDPDEGRILLDGIDLKQLDLVWLRNQIGYVGQQPVLFATSILQNLKLGYENATIQQINQALHQAEAYDFVHKQLQNGLQTYVGSGGGQISGGQKQRIAIARALLKKPRILLLDEATSALDRRNERLIQNTLNNVTKGITTVTVAHRIQSIMSANIIYVINRGAIIQKGEFNQLQRYKNFVNKQEGQIDVQAEEEVKQITKKPSLALKNSEKEMKIIIPKTKEEIQKQKDAQLVKQYEDGIYRRVFGYLKQQRLSFAIGIILTVILGGVYPVFSIFLSDIMNALFDLGSKTLSKRQSGRDSANIAALVFLILAGVNFLVTFLRDILTYIVGDEITNNIRKQAYNKLLKMPISWFDKPDNNCGILSKRLGTDCQTINGMATTYIYIMIQSLATLITGIIIALVYEWRIALVALGFMPLVMLAGAIRSAFRNGLSKKEDEAHKQSSQIVMESLTNIRTVVSFGVQNTVLNKYQRFIDQPQAVLTRNSAISGFFFGLSQVITFLVFGILFYIGTIFVRDHGATLLDIFTAIYQIFFAGITVGNNSHFLPDMNEAKVAASHIFKILDSEDEEQQQKREGSKMIKDGIKGHIKLQKVTFKYQTRNQYVFKDISLELNPSHKIAFVGPSGCGKSTILQLLQRFYEPESGTITLDGHNIKDYDIYYLRSKLGVVSQQPVLFNGTFRQNIIYNKYDATEQEMRHAASQANALLFIEGNQKLANTKQEDVSKSNLGFEKNVGLKGSHISGGQKQRVAIARAILRNPQILLLDEATSALDAQNEKKVQQSLDQIMKIKTTITIAHRIETIKNSDAIYVFQKGEIVEKGSYQSLVALKGFFYNLERGTQFL